jgi:hypothetical protein
MNKRNPKSMSISVIPSRMPEIVLVFLSDGLPQNIQPKSIYFYPERYKVTRTTVKIKIADRYLNFYLLESSSGLFTFLDTKSQRGGSKITK